MSKTDDLLIEIGTEELPPRELRGLALAFATGLLAALTEQRLTAPGAQVESFAAPRRIAARVSGVAAKQGSETIVRRGPAVAAAFTADGAPTAAAMGFARSLNIEVDALERLTTDRGEFVAYRERRTGRPLAAVLPAVLDAALQQLPAGRRMRWGSGDAEFVRPVHWAVALYGPRVLRVPVLSVMTGRRSRGHRFHAPGPLIIPHAAAYADTLASKGHVIARFEQRQETIRAQVEALAASIGAQALIDPALLDLVTALVEWPHAVLGEFDASFLEVPREALVAAMQDHQKYFPLEQSGHLLPRFITIANIEAVDDGAIRKGNERVLAARFADARFFWQTDRKKSLEATGAGLVQLAFEQRLGSVADKVARLRALARILAQKVGTSSDLADRAARLCKADLLTGMVGEFPELQGIMGGYYARHDGEDEQVAMAISEHYLPRFSGDRLPQSALGLVLALADKLDTLVGIFGVGLAPTGDKDPFALRRAAIGILRLLDLLGQQYGADLDMTEVLAATRAQYPDELLSSDVLPEVTHFLAERLRHLLEAQLPADVVAAALAGGLNRVHEGTRKAHALLAFAKTADAAVLVGAHKRIRNILKQNTEVLDKGVSVPVAADPAERALAEQVAAREGAVEGHMRAGRYGQALASLLELRPAVDTFFEKVLVMAEDGETRRARLSLLARLARLFEMAGDLSRLKI